MATCGGTGMDGRVEELLTLWGDYMRRAPGVPHLGYPTCSIGGQLLGRQPVRVKRELRSQPDRLVRDDDGQLVRQRGAALHMVPASQPKETRANRSWTPAEWPGVVDEVDRVIAQMTPREQRALRLRYWSQLSQAEAAAVMGIGITRYKQTLAAAQRFFAGYLTSLAA